jgi:hypothetical protein
MASQVAVRDCILTYAGIRFALGCRRMGGSSQHMQGVEEHTEWRQAAGNRPGEGRTQVPMLYIVRAAYGGNFCSCVRGTAQQSVAAAAGQGYW